MYKKVQFIEKAQIISRFFFGFYIVLFVFLSLSYSFDVHVACAPVSMGVKEKKTIIITS